MKKLVCLLAMICTILTLQAQKIEVGQVWWDGRIRFIVSEVDETTGASFFEGYDIEYNYYQFHLNPGKKDNQYSLNATGYIPFLRAEGGWEVDYINEDNIKFIAFKNPQGRIVSVITLMDGDLQDMRELYLNGITADEYPVKDLLNTYLMDAQYLCRFSPEELREMKAQLQEMGDLNIRGKVNIQLIDTELAMNPNERLKPLMSRDEFLDRITEEPEYDEEFEEGEELASKDLDFEEYQYVTVSDEREFILALGSNRTVRIADRTTLNLSKILNDHDFFMDNRHTNWIDGDMEDFHDYAVWIFSEDVYDGRQLTLHRVYNLTIQGGTDSKIVVEPRYACVFNLYECSNITFNNLTLGHTEDGYCVGAVLGAKNTNGISVYNCDLYGCGTYGLSAENSQNIVMVNTAIRECSEGIVWLIQCSQANFVNCDFYDNKSGVDTYHCTDMKFNNCRFFRNLGVLFNVDRKIMLDNCEMWQPEDSRGNENVLSYEEIDYIWNSDRGASEMRRGDVGPQKIGEGGLNDDGKGFDEYDPSLAVYFENYARVLNDYEETATNLEHKRFNKYAPIDLDGDGTPEICFRNRDNKHGAWYGQQAGFPVLLGLESQDFYADVILDGNWVVFRGYMGDNQGVVAIQMMNSTVLHVLAGVTKDGKTTYNLDNKDITKEQGDKIIHRSIKWNFADWQPTWYDLPD